MTEKIFKKGDVIFKEGTMGNTMYQIADGAVGIYVNYGKPDQTMLTEITKNQFLGEMGVIEVYPRSATAVAVQDTKAFEISVGDLTDYFKTQPDKIIEIMKHMGSRLRDLTENYQEVNNTLKAITPGDTSNRSDSIIDKIKKFANVYGRHKDLSTIESAETKRKISTVSHSEGYKGNVEKFSKGTVIFKEGETGDCMYDIHYGRVGIYTGYGTNDEKLLAELREDQFFGEMGMIQSVRRSATAVVLDDSTVIETIYLKDMENLFKENPPKVEMIIAHLSFRLRRLTNEYIEACKLVYEIYSAENDGTVSAELKQKIRNYENHIYE